jgi:dihydrofolate synthase / folylpolyglutamate synthase
MNLSLYQKYKSAEAYFESLQNLTQENFFKKGQSNPEHFFKRAQKLLELAGHPDKAYKIIHVTGTSGKGSTCNYIAQILINAGFKVGAHYSPFVSVATEKIQVNGKLISAEDFIDLVEEMKPIIQKCSDEFDTPSFFECWMVANLLYFKKQKVDWVVLEVGCGGRYDASNAILTSEMQIITNVGLDHQFILGDTVEKIAFEKAGIIRPNGHVITTMGKWSVFQVIDKEATKKNALVDIVYSDGNMNKAIATHVGNICLGIPEKIVKKSLKEVKMPARFEIMQKNPVVILDGAHNEDKIKFFTKKLEDFFTKSSLYKKQKPEIHLVCALTDNKEPQKVFKALKDIPHYVYATRFTNPFRKVTNPNELKKVFKHKKVQTFLDPQTALKTALKKAGKNDIVLVTGSFFLCSDLRKNWIDEAWQIEHCKNFK